MSDRRRKQYLPPTLLRHHGHWRSPQFEGYKHEALHLGTLLHGGRRQLFASKATNLSPVNVEPHQCYRDRELDYRVQAMHVWRTREEISEDTYSATSTP